VTHCFVGCAGWSLPRDVQDRFPAEGSHLQRYAAQFQATEINSSFHRPHKSFVWERWAQSVPPSFRFSAKLPKAITHERRLMDCEEALAAFFRETAPLDDRLACVLVQLPPSLAFERGVAGAFLGSLRRAWEREIALEPRHESWFSREADELLRAHRVARVLADPVRFSAAAAPGGWPAFVYVRLHGSPRMYYSAYSGETLARLSDRIAMELTAGRTVWCMFDNTASGAAVHDALTLQGLLRSRAAP
jgi:uncharacterized protein YecE (DUF72 family)